MSKNYNSLLFSKYFKYLWRLVFFRSFYTKSFDNLIVYGSYTKGFYIVCDNGITFKVVSAEKIPTFTSKQSYFVYAYYNDFFLMKYATNSPLNHSFEHNPFIGCKTKGELSYVIKSLYKILGHDSSVFDEKDNSVFININFNNFVYTDSSMGIVAKKTYDSQYQPFTGTFFVDGKHYLVKETYLVYIYAALKHRLQSDSSAVLKVSEYFKYCLNSTVYQFFDETDGEFVGFGVNIYGHFLSDMDMYFFNTKDFTYKKMRHSNLGNYDIETVICDYDTNKLNSIFNHFFEIVKLQLMNNPSNLFYEKAKELGLEIDKDQKLTPEIIEIFEMLNC